MIKRYLPAMTLATALLATTNAQAGIIDATSVLLDEANASQLEAWLGQGDLDWNSIWYGTTGATAQSWHEAVDNIGPTVSIYNITHDGQELLIGGYTDLNWAGPDGFRTGQGNSFIFNLETNQHFNVTYMPHEIYTRPYFFASFGGGLDLYAGRDAIGQEKGYSADHSYTTGIANAGQLLGVPHPESMFTVNALETFTFTMADPMTEVPEPSTLAICGLGLLGLIRFKAQKR